VGLLLLAGACGDERRVPAEGDEPVGVQREALTTVQARVLGFEGTIGGSSGDWRALSGTATSSTIRTEGTRAFSLSNGTSPARAASHSPLSGPSRRRQASTFGCPLRCRGKAGSARSR